jgi:Type II CAAX prenyl endopeptidase Rce1-like
MIGNPVSNPSIMGYARVFQFGHRVSENARSRQRDLAELFLTYGLILLVLWTPGPWQPLLWGVALSSMLAITYLKFDGPRSMGLGKVNLRRSIWVAGAALAMASIAVLLAVRFHSLQLPVDRVWFFKHYGAYVIWAFVQQLGLQCFFLPRLSRLLPDRISAAAMAAVLFAGAHLPSPILMLATLVWGFVACLLFLRYRDVYSLAIAHAILGIAIGITIPGALDHNMRVGLRYLTYMQQPAARATSPQPQ